MLEEKISALLKQSFSFDDALSLVKLFVSQNFEELHRNKNTILNNIENINKNSLEFIIVNYAAFSQDAIHMLLDAMLRSHDWPLLFNELQENINEEKGSETKGIPHLEIMREGYRKDLGLEVDMQFVKASKVTKRFLDTMRDIFNNDDNAFSAGALLAFEGTAIEEFYIIDLIIKKYFTAIKNNSDKDAQLPESLTKYYIDGHKLFEIGHEAHLIEAIKPYINKTNSQRMIRGYLACSLALNTWWNQLYVEANFNSNYNLIQNFEQQQTSVFKSIFKKR